MSELPLSIPVQSVSDFFNCPVCMSRMKSTFMTPCGHRYCENCIKECVARHHKCPCCNLALVERQLIKDLTFDELIRTVDAECVKSESHYFSSLIDAAATDGSSSSSPDVFSPVERVLKDHLKHGLASHDHYYKQLKHDFDHRVLQLEAEFTRMTDDLKLQNLSEEEWTRQLADLASSCDRQKKVLQDELLMCSTSVAEAYDRYLSEYIPSLSILPITVSLNILSKNIRFPDVILKPEQTLTDVRQMFQHYMQERGDSIVKFGENVKFVSFGPFFKRSQYEMHQIASDIVEHGATHKSIHILPEKCRLILQFGLKPGTEISLYGMVQCESDRPKQCFAATFKQGQTHTVDYFSCRQCNFNWVCRSCMEVCHKEHEVVPYIMNHQPTWACCYCPKKKKCTIQYKEMSNS